MSDSVRQIWENAMINLVIEFPIYAELITKIGCKFVHGGTNEETSACAWTDGRSISINEDMIEYFNQNPIVKDDEGKEVNRERVVASEVNVHGFHGFDTDREREPVYKNRKRGLHNSPAGADNGALVCFNQLVFREQKDLFSKSLVFLENRSNQKTTSLNIEKNIQITVNKTQNDGLNYKSCSPP